MNFNIQTMLEPDRITASLMRGCKEIKTVTVIIGDEEFTFKIKGMSHNREPGTLINIYEFELMEFIDEKDFQTFKNQWQDKLGDPVQDMQNTKLLLDKEPVFEPGQIVVNKEQYIQLKAMELFLKFKADWRKKHPILSFMERVMNKITGGK